MFRSSRVVLRLLGRALVERLVVGEREFIRR